MRTSRRSSLINICICLVILVLLYDQFERDIIPNSSSLSSGVGYEYDEEFDQDDDGATIMDTTRSRSRASASAMTMMIDPDNISTPSGREKTIQDIQLTRNIFYTYYGGKEEAIAMLQRGIIPASSSSSSSSSSPKDDLKEGFQQSEEERKARKAAMSHTAERILRAMNKDDKKFVMGFGGYSVTLGRGNYFHQSYPFVMQDILKPVFESIGVDLVVRNAGIGGVTSFPYGFCLPNFLGSDADVVSWDFSMSDGWHGEKVESYLRQIVSTLPKRPMMIMLDNNKERVDMIRKYHYNGVLLDSIAVGGPEVVNDKFLKREEYDRPIGFQRWKEWGAPKGTPGQVSWHPTYRVHELIGWMVAMHFLDAVEIAMNVLDEGAKISIDNKSHEQLNILPKPESTFMDSDAARLMYGIPLNETDSNGWKIDRVSCRSSFFPHVYGNISDIVVEGLAQHANYDQWVFDLGKDEKGRKALLRNKLKRQKIDPGYIDSKYAVFGLPESGTLQIELPFEGSKTQHKHYDQQIEKLASHWFKSLVICGVDNQSKKKGKECELDKDITFFVGGSQAEAINVTEAATYGGKHLCVSIGIPSDAEVMWKGRERDREVGNSHSPILNVNATVTGKEVTKNGPCSISHVIWQSR